MKRFQFTLDSVLTVRKRQEQEAAATYAQALLSQQLVVARLNSIDYQLKASVDEARAQITEGCSAAQLVQASVYHRSLEKRHEDCLADMRFVERQVNAALQRMLAARQQREVVGKFFDKQKKRYDYDCGQEERKFMDDLASCRAASAMSFMCA